MTGVTDIHHHDNGLPRQLDVPQLLALVEELLDSGGRLVFRDHAYVRMEERDITTSQIMQVLRRGEVTQGPTWSAEYRNWTFTMSADTAGERVTVAAAIDVAVDGSGGRGDHGVLSTGEAWR